MSEHLLKEQFALLRAKCASGALRDTALRTARLKALRNAVRAARREILSAFQSDCARPETEVRCDEIAPVLRALRRVLPPVPCDRAVRALRGPGRCVRQPFGVVLVTADWSTPFRSAMEAVIAAVAAGNCVMLKPAAETQSVTALTVRLLREVFPDDEVLSVHAGLAELLALPFDAVYVSGDRSDALRTAETAALRLGFCRTRVRRRHWCVVLPGSGITGCARRIVRGKFRNAGQHPAAPDYLLVHKDVKDALMLALRRELRRAYGDDPAEAGGYGRMVDDFHYRRAAAFLDAGRLAAGGEHHPDDRYIAPTILDTLDEECVLLREPVAGPILPVWEFETPGDALDMIRRHPETGALSVFGATRRVRERMLAQPCAAVAFEEIAEVPCVWNREDFFRTAAVTERRTFRALLAAAGSCLNRWKRTAAGWFAK